MARSYSFGLVEYLVFFGLLGVSATIGVFHGLRSKSASVDEYMLGGRKMPLLPVALSLAASFLSGVTLLGIPAETYEFGTQLYGICLAIASCYFFMTYFYLPVIYDLQAKSLFQYLELRFDKSVRTLASFVYALSVVLILPVIIYVPALAFNQVTGISLHLLAPLICGICIFYTSLGGLKAVVWSDALQSTCVLFALAALIVIGLRSVGGIANMIRLNQEGERLEIFNFDPNPMARNTFWTTCVGSLPTWLMAFATNPATAQRYISLPTYRQADMSVLIMAVGIVVVKSLSTLTGLILYARYHDCDPLLAKEVEKADQLLPHFTMEVAADYPGLAGLFMAGVVCTALSTMSTMLNTIAGTVYEDFLRNRLPWEQTDRAANRSIQLLTVVLGLLTTALVFVVERLGTVMQVAVSMQGVTNGVLLFMFTFGMFIPWGNSKGVKAGTAGGLVATLVLVTGAGYHTQAGNILFHGKLTTLSGCAGNLSATAGFAGPGTRVEFADSVPHIFRLSYLYYSLVGLGTALALGTLVSLATRTEASVDPRLLVPQLRPATVHDQQLYNKNPHGAPAPKLSPENKPLEPGAVLGSPSYTQQTPGLLEGITYLDALHLTHTLPAVARWAGRSLFFWNNLQLVLEYVGLCRELAKGSMRGTVLNLSTTLMGTLCSIKVGTVILFEGDILAIIQDLREMDSTARRLLPEGLIAKLDRERQVYSRYSFYGAFITAALALNWNIRPVILLAYGQRELAIEAWFPFDLEDLFIWWFVWVNQVIHVPSAMFGFVGYDALCTSLLEALLLQLDHFKACLRQLDFADDHSSAALGYCSQLSVDLLLMQGRINKLMRYTILAQTASMTLVICLGVFELLSVEGTSFAKVINLLSMLVVGLFSTFLFCYVCQQVTAENLKVIEAAFDNNWYEGSHKEKTALFLLIEGWMRDYRFGFIIDSDLQTFITVLKTSFTYYNFLKAISGEEPVTV